METIRRTLVITTLLVSGSGASAAVAVPPGPPPKVGGTSVAPPPAWIEAGKVQKWLAYSSYCWTTACVDFIPPAMRTDVPSLTVRRGRAVTIHFRFLPKNVTVRGLVVAPGRIVTWRPRTAGLALVAADAATGDASYLVRIRLR